MALTRPRLGQLNTSVVAQADPITVLNQGSSSANIDVGFLFNRANGLVSNVALYWSESAQSIVTAYTTSSGSTNANISVDSYANLTVGNVLLVTGSILNVQGNIAANTTGILYGNVNSSGNISTSGNVYASSFFYANGTPFVSSSYGNTTVASYLPTYSGSIGAASEIVTLTANAGAQAGQIAGANAAIITANTALKAYTDAQITTTQSWVAGANAAIVTANTALKAYTDNQISTANTALKSYVDAQDSAITTAWTANAVAQANQIAGANVNIARIDANLGSFQTYANVTFGTSSYGNVQMLANLAAGSNPVTFGSNIVANSGTASTSATTGALTVAGGVGISGNITASGNIYAVGTNSKHGYTWANSVSSAYTVFNSATNSIDTVFG